MKSQFHKDKHTLSLTLIFSLLLIAMLFSCENEEKPPVSADFDYEFQGDCSSSDLKVLFENKSLNADSYLWNFGDGTLSREINPVKIFDKSGDYKVTLTAITAIDSSSIGKEVHIFRNSDGKGPSAEFTYSVNIVNLNVTFEANSEMADSYQWNFGHGGPKASTDSKQIKHSYPGPGIYSVTLTTTNSEGTNCFSTTIKLGT